MNYEEFFQRFGRSLETKNIRKRNWFGRVKRRGRDFVLPPSSEAPERFIGLCPWEAEYLFMIARRARAGILETGRRDGGSVFLMACAAPDVPIWSIDIAPRGDERLRELFAARGVGSNVVLITGDSQKTQYPEIGEIDVLFIDGDHTYEGCMNDLTNWYSKLKPNGHLILHDSYRGKHGVQDAVADFMNLHTELLPLQSPFIGSEYWIPPVRSRT